MQKTTDRQLIQELLSDPTRLIQKKPYTRQIQAAGNPSQKTVDIGQKIQAQLPTAKYQTVTESQLLAELDPFSHKVLFDDNIPSITVKRKDGDFVELEYARMPVSFQRNILDKQVLHLCSNPMQFTLLNTDPTDKQQRDFITFKQAWDGRNIDGRKTDFVRKAKSCGCAAMLFYFDHQRRVKARTLSFEDGYQICSHLDDNGDHILETVYYQHDGVTYIDSYDDTYRYRYTSADSDITSAAAARGGWIWHDPVKHGFPEIPLVAKNTRVAWDRVQFIIEVYEVISNIFAVCQKKYGWGILYVKGSFNPQARKIAGYQVLNDSSLDPNADAKLIDPPTVQGMIDFLDKMEQLIQLGSGTTFILPKDIKLSGDTSGVAIQLTQELDIETARNGISEWQNCASKMARLFLAGLAAELTLSGDPEHAKAITDFATLDISAKFQLWRPQSDTEYSQMLTTLAGAGAISRQTLIEKNPASTPDETARIRRQAIQDAADQSQQQTPADQSQQQPPAVR